MRYPKLFLGSILAATLLMGGLLSAVHYVPPAKYGQEFTLHFSIYDSNSPWQYYETAPAADDVYLRKDGGAAARATNAVTDLNHTMSLVLTAAEMTAAVVTVDVNDEDSPALYGSDTWVIYTYGNASATHAFDLDDADPSVDVTKINNVATSSVTTVNANLGTTAAVAFTGALLNVHLKGADDNVIVDPNAADVWSYATRILTALDEDDTTIDLDASAVGSVAGNVGGTVNGLTATALADLFDMDSGTTYAAAAAGSVVKEIADNAGGASLDLGEIADEVVTHMDANSADLDAILAAGGGDAGALADEVVAHMDANSTQLAAIAEDTAAYDTDAEYAAAIWNAAIASYGTGGSYGEELEDLDPNVTLILADTDELQGDWVDGGRLDLILDAAGGAGDPWLTALPGAYAAGTAGKILGDLPADVAEIVDGIGTMVPTTDTADVFAQTAGSVISGAIANTQTDDDTRHVLAPANPGGLDATYTFQTGASRSPVAVSIQGYWSGSGKSCDVYTWDYTLEIWDKLTNSTTRLNSTTKDTNYTYQLNREHMDTVASPGNILIRFVSTSTTTANRLNLDRILVATVAEAIPGSGDTTTLTPQEVWEYAVRTLTSDSGEPTVVDINVIAEYVRAEMDANSVDLNTILADTNELQTDWTNGGRLDLLLDGIKAMTDLIAVVTTTVAGPNDANNFTITAGADVNDAYTNMAVMVEDATDGHAEVRWIEEYTTGREILVDEPFSFTPEAADNVWIMGTTYGGWMQQILNALNISKVPVYYMDATGGGASEGAGGVTNYQSDGTDP